MHDNLLRFTRLTLFTSRLTGLLSSHHETVAAGFDPELTHSTSYDLSAERYLSLDMMCTAAGFTVLRLRGVREKWHGEYIRLNFDLMRHNKDAVWLNSQCVYARFTSRMTTLLLGGVRFVLLAMQTSRAFTCCRPMFGYDKWLTVLPSGRCSNVSSITVLSRYQVTFGRGTPAIGNVMAS